MIEKILIRGLLVDQISTSLTSTNIKIIVWQTVRKVANKILGVKG